MVALLALVLLLDQGSELTFKRIVLAKQHVGPDKWVASKLECYSGRKREWDFDAFELRRNGRLVMSRREDYGPLRNAKFLRWPYKLPLFVYSEHSWCGHGQDNWFYVIRNRHLCGPLLHFYGEFGGPVFRDLDQDGRPEMLFDNEDWYRFYGKGPTRYRAYKVSKDLEVRYWKSIRAPHRKRLPFKLPYF